MVVDRDAFPSSGGPSLLGRKMGGMYSFMKMELFEEDEKDIEELDEEEEEEEDEDSMDVEREVE